MRRGRPPKFIKDGHGREVKGLSCQPFKDDRVRYYATFAKPRKWFGVGKTDDAKARDKAIGKFRVWLSTQSPEMRALCHTSARDRSRRSSRAREAIKLLPEVADE